MRGAVLLLVLLAAGCGPAHDGDPRLLRSADHTQRRDDGPAIPYRGRVVRSSDGAPVAGAKIRLVPGSANGVNIWMGCPGAVADADGRFDAEVPGYGSKYDTVWMVAQAPGWLQREPAAVPRGSTDAVTLTVEPAASVSGRVVDGAGRGIEGCDVTVFRRDELSRAADNVHDIRYTSTDAEGRFEFTELLPDVSITLNVYHREHAHARDEPKFRLKGGEHRDGVVITLGAAGKLRVRVVDPEGKDARNAHVTLFRGSEPPGSIRGNGISLGRRGEAVFVNLRPGTYRLELSPFFPWHMDAPVEVEITGGEEKRVTLQVEPAPRITGTVLDVNGNPAKEVAILGMPEGHVGHATRRGRTDLDGAFRLIVGKGTYRLSAVSGSVGNRPKYVGEARAKSGATGVVIRLKPYNPR